MRKKIFAVAAFMCAIICVAGVNAFFRDISQTPGKAIPNLILAVVCALLTVLSVRKIRNPARRTASVQKASPSKPLTAKAIQPEMRIPNPADLISIHTEHIDPDEGLKTPAWAELSYLDAQALEFWNGKPTDFQIPSYYADTAFGRNVGPARSRLLKGGYLRRGSVQKSIERKTIPELKAILAEKELKLSGKKGELVQRLLNNVPPDELEELFPIGVYEATEKGWRARDQYEIVFYQELLPKAARFMDGNGEPLKALEVSVLSYFVWTMEVKTLSARGLGHGADMQNPYLARNVEEYARKCGLTFDQLLEHFAVTVRENKPFALSSEANIRYAADMLKRGLSIRE